MDEFRVHSVSGMSPYDFPYGFHIIQIDMGTICKCESSEIIMELGSKCEWFRSQEGAGPYKKDNDNDKNKKKGGRREVHDPKLTCNCGDYRV